MKKVITLMALVFCLGIKAQTNVYHPFPTGNAEWFRHVIPQGCSGGCPYYRDIQLGDTLINLVSYKKIYEQQGTWFPSCGSSTPCFTPSGSFTYIGALRQDSVAKKVYYFPTNLSYDTLLYDFNLALGDTLAKTYLTAYSSGNIYPTVKKIDSVLISGKYHKSFLLFDTVYSATISYLIEGVGNSSGLLLGYSIEFEGYATLDCFNQNAIPISGTSGVGGICPEEIAGISQLSGLNIQISIYPNPAKDLLHIECEVVNEKTEIVLTDMLGNIVKRVPFNTQHLTLNIADLSEGVYNVSISSSEEVINKRLVIVR